MSRQNTVANINGLPNSELLSTGDEYLNSLVLLQVKYGKILEPLDN